MATESVRYIGPHAEVELPSVGVTVERGKATEVDEAVAKRLVKQADWELSAERTTPAKKDAPKTDAAKRESGK